MGCRDQLTFKGIGRVEVDGDIAVDGQVGRGRRGRDGVVIRDIDVDHDFIRGRLACASNSCRGEGALEGRYGGLADRGIKEDFRRGILTMLQQPDTLSKYRV